MTATFLVAVVFDDPADLPHLAGEIEDAIIAADIDVESVKPWQRTTELPSVPNLNQPLQ